MENEFVPYYAPFLPPPAPAPKKDIFGSIVSGLTSVLGALFPTGVLGNNNPNSVPTYYPVNPNGGGQGDGLLGNNSLIPILLVGLVVWLVAKK